MLLQQCRFDYVLLLFLFLVVAIRPLSLFVTADLVVRGWSSRGIRDSESSQSQLDNNINNNNIYDSTSISNGRNRGIKTGKGGGITTGGKNKMKKPIGVVVPSIPPSTPSPLPPPTTTPSTTKPVVVIVKTNSPTPKRIIIVPSSKPTKTPPVAKPTKKPSRPTKKPSKPTTAAVPTMAPARQPQPSLPPSPKPVPPPPVSIPTVVPTAAPRPVIIATPKPTFAPTPPVAVNPIVTSFVNATFLKGSQLRQGAFTMSDPEGADLDVRYLGIINAHGIVSLSGATTLIVKVTCSPNGTAHGLARVTLVDGFNSTSATSVLDLFPINATLIVDGDLFGNCNFAETPSEFGSSITGYLVIETISGSSKYVDIIGRPVNFFDIFQSGTLNITRVESSTTNATRQRHMLGSPTPFSKSVDLSSNIKVTASGVATPTADFQLLSVQLGPDWSCEFLLTYGVSVDWDVSLNLKAGVGKRFEKQIFSTPVRQIPKLELFRGVTVGPFGVEFLLDFAVADSISVGFDVPVVHGAYSSGQQATRVTLSSTGGFNAESVLAESSTFDYQWTSAQSALDKAVGTLAADLDLKSILVPILQFNMNPLFKAGVAVDAGFEVKGSYRILTPFQPVDAASAAPVTEAECYKCHQTEVNGTIFLNNLTVYGRGTLNKALSLKTIDLKQNLFTLCGKPKPCNETESPSMTPSYTPSTKPTPSAACPNSCVQAYKLNAGRNYTFDSSCVDGPGLHFAVCDGGPAFFYFKGIFFNFLPTATSCFANFKVALVGTSNFPIKLNVSTGDCSQGDLMCVPQASYTPSQVSWMAEQETNYTIFLPVSFTDFQSYTYSTFTVTLTCNVVTTAPTLTPTLVPSSVVPTETPTVPETDPPNPGTPSPTVVFTFPPTPLVTTRQPSPTGVGNSTSSPTKKPA